jgi:DNA-binding NarL/FixJ family response regulator
MEHPIRLGLVDDHDLFRETLADALRVNGYQVVFEAGDARDGLVAAGRAAPDVLLLDLGLPATDGVQAIRALRARATEPRILVLSASENPRDVGAAWAAGADGYATKHGSLELLLEGVREVASGKRYLAPGLTVGNDGDDALAPLSRREREVFKLIVSGLTSAAIATQLHVSVKTIETHRERVLKKLGLHSAVQLVRFAAEHSLLEP